MRTLLVISVALLMVISCQSSKEYCICEDDMLYVKAKPSPSSHNFVFTDRFGRQRIPNPDLSKPSDEFMEAHEFSCGLALVRGYDKKWRYINRKGDTVIEAPYDKCWSFGEFYESDLGFNGLARVNNGIKRWGGMGWNEGGKYGLIDTKGRVVLPVEYDEIINFDEEDRSRWMIKKDGVWGLIDDKAKIIITPQYDKLDYYRGYACVEKQHRAGMLDKNGKVIVPLRYDSIVRLAGDSVRAYRQGIAVLINKKGKVVF
ncbi:WG repeat-containing protein [Bacteroides acidifaciens]|jgi:hypothetical protein|uniref:WG repeat-containing protein n=1 Tax=Bacteroides acidifaciens TaxID=85831 RepID=UPI002570A66D|nr:WG repeat-containing protein [Bacteroides acidifaciens]